MTRPFALQTVLELMQTRTDEATAELARLIASERDARNKLAMLQQYRDEYTTRFRLAIKNGITQQEWRNFQEFIERLEEAITAQQRAVDQQIRKTVDGQKRWQEQRKKLKAIDTLSNRHYASEARIAEKNEQKLQDEFSARNTRREQENE